MTWRERRNDIETEKWIKPKNAREEEETRRKYSKAKYWTQDEIKNKKQEEIPDVQVPTHKITAKSKAKSKPTEEDELAELEAMVG